LPENSDWISCSGCENSRSSGEKPNFDPKPQKTRNDSSYQLKVGKCFLCSPTKSAVRTGFLSGDVVYCPCKDLLHGCERSYNEKRKRYDVTDA